MDNEIRKPQARFTAVPVHQQAERIVNVEHADTVKTQNTIIISSGLPGLPGTSAAPFRCSRDYYNLIVYGQEPLLQAGHITFEKSRCLVEKDNITPELKARFSPLSSAAIEELKTFLCIIACENHHYGWTDEDHYASVARLSDIKNRSNGIELYFQPIFAVPQAWLNEYAAALGICGSYRKFNELNHSHWTVKEIDLLEVLNDAGLNPLRG